MLAVHRGGFLTWRWSSVLELVEIGLSTAVIGGSLRRRERLGVRRRRANASSTGVGASLALFTIGDRAAATL